jgi:aconitate hydratase
MGVLPLQFTNGQSRDTVGVTEADTFDITGLEAGLKPGAPITVTAHHLDGTDTTFDTIARIDSGVEVEYYANGGVLQMVLRRLLHDLRS